MSESLTTGANGRNRAILLGGAGGLSHDENLSLACSGAWNMGSLNQPSRGTARAAASFGRGRACRAYKCLCAGVMLPREAAALVRLVDVSTAKPSGAVRLSPAPCQLLSPAAVRMVSRQLRRWAGMLRQWHRILWVGDVFDERSSQDIRRMAAPADQALPPRRFRGREPVGRLHELQVVCIIMVGPIRSKEQATHDYV